MEGGAGGVDPFAGTSPGDCFVDSRMGPLAIPVCGSVSGMAVSTSCEPTGGAPCSLQWRLTLVQAVGDAGDETAFANPCASSDIGLTEDWLELGGGTSGAGAGAGGSGGTVRPVASGQGLFRLLLRSVDAAGNLSPVIALPYWVSFSAPPSPGALPT
jgi:hypothetical protein